MAETAPTPPPLDGTLLEQPLSGPPPQASEGDAPDARVEALTEAVARGDYATAALSAEALLREGVHDARLIGPYLFGAFQERGLLAMASLFRSVHLALTASHAALGPVDKRDVFLDSGLRWLLRTLNKHLAHHEKKKDATWQRWCEADCRPPLEEALALTEPILTALATTLPKNGCEEPFRNLTLWLSRHVQALPAPPRPAPKVEPPAAASGPSTPAGTHEASAPGLSTPTSTGAAAAPDNDPSTGAGAVPPRVPLTAAPAPPQHHAPGLPISPAMALLLRKLAAFDALLERGEATKAGVVAADVLATVERFDPRVYLPALFSRFFSGLSTHAQALEPFLQEPDSLPMRALEQLYRVDLDAFLAQPASRHGEED